MISRSMAAAGAPSNSTRGLHGSPLLARIVVTVVFGWALLIVDEVILANQQAAYQTIRFIQGTFAPLADARRLYLSASVSRAIDAGGSQLPEVTVDGKIRGYDMRIIEQAS